MMVSEFNAVSKKQVAAHYEATDPHRKVAGSKQAFFSHVLKVLKKPDQGQPTLLDVGCGYGYFMQLASGKGWQVSGVEIAREAVNVARSKIGDGNIYHGSLKSASLPDRSFDAVTLWDVLVLAPDPAEELGECFRILKTGGTIGLRVRNVTFQKWLHRIYLQMEPIFLKFSVGKPYVFHPRNFSKKALYLLLRRTGFTNVQVSNSPLTEGDPYGLSPSEGPVRTLKRLMEGAANVLYQTSSGRCVSGPSLLVWAEKPDGDEPDKPNTHLV